MAKIPAPGSKEEEAAARARSTAYFKDKTKGDKRTWSGLNDRLYRDSVSNLPNPVAAARVLGGTANSPARPVPKTPPKTPPKAPVAGDPGGLGGLNGPTPQWLKDKQASAAKANAKVSAKPPAVAKPASTAPKTPPKIAPKPAPKADPLASLRKDKAFMADIAPRKVTAAAPTPKTPAKSGLSAGKSYADYKKLMGD